MSLSGKELTHLYPIKLSFLMEFIVLEGSIIYLHLFTCILGDAGRNFQIIKQNIVLVIHVTNCVVPDEMLHSIASDLALRGLQMFYFLEF